MMLVQSRRYGTAAAMFVIATALGCGEGMGILLGEVTSPISLEAGVGSDTDALADDSRSGLVADASSDVADDSSSDSDMSVADAAVDSGTVPGDANTNLGAFGPPVLVQELVATGFHSFKETLTANMLDIYFCSQRPGGPGNGDVWHAKRARTTDVWGPPNCVLEVSTASVDQDPAVSPDGLTLWLSSDRPGGKGNFDIWVSTRPNVPTAKWTTPKPVTELNTTSDEFPRPPILSGLIMPPSYRAAADAGHQFQTFLTSRASLTAPWTAPLPLKEVNTSTVDTDGFLTDDQLVLYFSSDRAGGGNQDLYVARRSSPTSPFTQFAPIAELNTTHAERDPWVSQDGHDIYFSSDRSGTLQIYHATR